MNENPLQNPNPQVVAETNPPSQNETEREDRKAIIAKRLFWVFIVLSIIMVGLIVWECLDIFLF